MVCIRRGLKRGRPGKWIVDYRDSSGVRRWVTCQTLNQAKRVYGEKIWETNQSLRCAVDPNTTLAAYSERWLRLVSASVKPRTYVSYELHIRRHILPAFGPLKVRQLTKGQIKEFLAENANSGPAARSTRNIYATFRAILNAAIDDGLIFVNPAARLGRPLHLSSSPKDREHQIKAMDRDQLCSFLKAAASSDPRRYALWLLLARTGMRLGEAFGLQWKDLDYERREIIVERALSPQRQVSTPKTGRSRRVDMSLELRGALRRLQRGRNEEKLLQGWADYPPWVFCTRVGTALEPSRVEKAFKRVLKAAKLPQHFTPHSLRHTYASILLQQGESPAYVQRQLGHASIQLTVDTYGRWLPMGNKAAVDRLDSPSGGDLGASGSRMVAAGLEGALKWRARRDSNPRPTGARKYPVERYFVARVPRGRQECRSATHELAAPPVQNARISY